MRALFYPVSMSHKGIITLIFFLCFGMWMKTSAQDSLQVFRSLDSVRAMNDDTLKVSRLLSKAKNYYRFFDKRKQDNPFLLEAINISNKIRYNKGLAEAYNELGTAKRNRSEYIIAADYHEKALRAARESKNKRQIAIALNNTGVDYRRREMLQKAFEMHLEALKVAEEINDVRNITIAINSIGNIRLSSGKYQEAIDEFTKSLRIEQQSNNDLGVAINLGNLGYAYEGLGQMDKAIEYYNRSLAVNQKIGDAKGMAICYTCLGTAYQKKKNYRLAMEYLQKALEVNESVDDKVHLAESNLAIGELLTEEGRLDDAREYIEAAVDLGLQWDFKFILQDAYKALGDNYRAARNFDRSIDYTNLSLKYKDTLLEEKYTTEYAQVEAMYAVHQKDNQIRLLQQEQDINQLRIRRNLAIAIALAGFLFMLIVGGFFYIRHRNLQANRQTLQLELRSLRSQMNPHFIFNSLSSIHRYIWSNNQEEASDYLTKFSKLMRMILDNSQHTFIPLNKELESLRLYLDLEALRCNNVFDYRIHVAENINDEEVLIPPMIVQPYVENAIWHGLVHRKEKKGLLDIEVGLNGKVLEVTVTDNGIGRKMAMEIKEKKDRTHNSMGMKVTEGRIALIRKINNTKDANVEVKDLEDQGQAAGTQVKIILPAEFLF